MNTRSKVGIAAVLFSYILLVTLIPPLWFPWSAPFGLGGILLGHIGSILVAIIGGTLVAAEFVDRSSSKVSAVTVSVTGPVCAFVPIYVYAVLGGNHPTALANIAPFFLAIIAGLVTAR